MALLDLSAYKPVPATLGDANQIASGFTAIQAVVNALDNNNFGAGKIFDLTKLMVGGAGTGALLHYDGTNWAKTTNVIIDNALSKITLGGDTTLYRNGGQLASGAVGGFVSVRAVATDSSFGTIAADADANFTFSVQRDGKLRWGAGGASALDTNLYRSAAATLKTDHNFHALTISNDGTGFFDTSQAGIGAGSLRLSVAGDAQYRFTLANTGAMAFGPGNLAADTTLYRSAAAVLKTDGTFWAVGDLVVTNTVQVKAGAGVPGAGLGSNGDFFLRVDGGGAGATHLYFKTGGAWIGIA